MPLFGRDRGETLEPEPAPQPVEQEGDSFAWPPQEAAAVAPDDGVESDSPVAQDVATPQAEEQSVGLYGKFHVERVDGKDRPGGPKEGAKYFVLDYVNDPVARIALRAYVTELRRQGIESDLAEELNREINALRRR